jgi:hypothetical protein
MNHETNVIAAIVTWLVSIGWNADMAESVAREFIREHRNSPASGVDE